VAALPATSPSRARVAQLLWAGFLLLAAAELLAHFTTVSRVPPRADWRAAAAFVRAAWQPGDLATSAPGYTDPLLREVLGDRLGLAEAGRSDDDAYTRLWVLSIDGERAPDEPHRAAELVRTFGRVTVSRWSLGPSPMRFDLVRHIRDADVVRIDHGAELPCPWRDFMTASGGGLGAGALTPRERFACDPGRPWLWVAETVTEDLAQQPRDCVYQHPPGREPERVTFHDVLLGTRLVLYAGIYSEHERMRDHGPVDLVVKVNGREIGRMEHRDGDGWKRMEAATTEHDGTRGELSIEVSAQNPDMRTFCWAAKTEAGPRRPLPPEPPAPPVPGAE